MNWRAQGAGGVAHCNAERLPSITRCVSARHRVHAGGVDNWHCVRAGGERYEFDVQRTAIEAQEHARRTLFRQQQQQSTACTPPPPPPPPTCSALLAPPPAPTAATESTASRPVCSLLVAVRSHKPLDTYLSSLLVLYNSNSDARNYRTATWLTNAYDYQ